MREYEFEKVIAENPDTVGRLFRELKSPMGPDHDIWAGTNSYDQGNSGGSVGPAAGGRNPWVEKPALSLLGVGLVLGGLGMRLARI